MAVDISGSGLAAGSSGAPGTGQKAGDKLLGQDLPQRFVCHVCGICVATSDNLLDTRDDVVIFSRLHMPDHGDQGVRTLACPCCGEALGTRSDHSVILRLDRAAKRMERLEILVCSLKQQEIREVTPALQEAFPHCNVTSKVLLKAELRGFQLTGMRPVPDLVVIAHRNEGRTLLTDRNGFYHDVIGSAWQNTRGNVLVILTRVEPKGDSELFDKQLLHSLSTQGDQPTIGAISALGRVLTWGDTPSGPQLEQLQMLLTRAYFREPPSLAQGIPNTWCKPVGHAHMGGNKASSAWCNLL
mmetsp:Transcript_1794/g.5097  ORF Transcript_1794/g.5097 Transcript_1794/m.5097 type:complete len:299 (-) Transcript_1794:111-1007(-)